MSSDHKLILYDGVCGLCNALVQFIIRRDNKDRFRFAQLQSALGRDIVTRHGGDPDALSTVYLVEGLGLPDESVRTRGKAVFYAVDTLGGFWRLPGILRFFPAFLLNLGYRLVARLRYRLFGRLETCSVPSPEQRAKFVD